MDGSSCGLKATLTPANISSAGAVGSDTHSEKHCASVDKSDKTCQLVKGGNGSVEAELCMGFSKSVRLGNKKGLRKSVTFPASSIEVEAQQEGGDSCCHADMVMTDALAFERSMSLPPTLKLLSAMKGSRQKYGITRQSENRHVKWAPDVYDPPVTSVCHSVNSSYQRRSKPRKKEKNKQKKKQKGKSKKSQQNLTVPQAPDLGLKDGSTSGGESSPEDIGKHEAVILDYSMGNQEAKCGSSFLRESAAKMHFSIAEAS